MPRPKKKRSVQVNLNPSDDAKGQLASIQTVDRRIGMLQEEMAILQTARMAYTNALNELMPVNGTNGSEKIQ